ncbi:MAG: BspA family leucine-rich repeat surface protein [Coriobacteriales bacterium]|nr:BspA family leucine-rich repeat surface protein [Coriobacteriales bacterium]
MKSKRAGMAACVAFAWVIALAMTSATATAWAQPIELGLSADDPSLEPTIELTSDVMDDELALVEDTTCDPAQVEVQATPTSGTVGGCAYTVANRTLTIFAGTTGILDANSVQEWPWRNDSNITKVVISSGVKAGPSLCGLFQGMTGLKSIEGLYGLTNGRVVTDMSYMFYQCYALDTNLSDLDTSNVTNMSYMFKGMSFDIVNLADFNTDKATNMEGMFEFCTSLTRVSLAGANTSQVTNMSSMFATCWNLVEFRLGYADTSRVTTMASMFDGCERLERVDFSGADTARVTDMSRMFSSCEKLANVSRNIRTLSAKNMRYMFYGCKSLTAVDLSTYSFASVTDLAGMFSKCVSMQSIVLPDGGAPKAEALSSMFEDCHSLISISGITKLATRSATDLSSMFWGCSSLQSLDLSGWNTSSATKMQWMFDGCEKLATINLKGWTTPACTSMAFMFWNCGVSELDLSGFDTRAAGTLGLTGMFGCCNSLCRVTFGPNFCVRQPRYVDTEVFTTQSDTYDKDDETSLLIDQMVYEDALPTGVDVVTGANVRTLLNDGDSWVLEAGERTPRTSDYVMNYHATARGTTVTWVWKSKAKPVSKTSLQNAKVALASSSLAYNGKVRLPTIKTVGGKTLNKGTDFVVRYSNSSSAAIGTYKVWVVGKGSYAGTSAKATYKIVPKSTSIAKLTARRRAFVASWSKRAKVTTGYQVQYARSKTFSSGKKTVTIGSKNKTSTKISGLASGKRYYVRVRTFKKVGSTRYYSAWSAAKSVRTR